MPNFKNSSRSQAWTSARSGYPNHAARERERAGGVSEWEKKRERESERERMRKGE